MNFRREFSLFKQFNVAVSNSLQNAPRGSNFSQNGLETTKLRLLSNSILKARSLWLEISMSVSTSRKKLDTFSVESKYGIIFFWKFVILLKLDYSAFPVTKPSKIGSCDYSQMSD